MSSFWDKVWPAKVTKVNITPAEEVRKALSPPSETKESEWETKILGTVVWINSIVEDRRFGHRKPRSQGSVTQSDESLRGYSVPKSVYYHCDSKEERNYVSKRFTSAGYTINHHDRLGLTLEIFWS